MSNDKARRGRPKGSGLDDRMHLDAIRGLIAGDPSLKPTTAIKMLGIKDPSVIRRLRDKLKGEDVGPGSEPNEIMTPRRESLESVTILPQSIAAQYKVSELPGAAAAVLERVGQGPTAGGFASARQALKVVAHAAEAHPLPSASADASREVRADTAPQPAHRPSVETRARTDASPSQADARSKPETQSPPAPERDAAKASNSFSSGARTESHGDEVTTLLVRWYALGVTAAFATAEAQAKVMQSVFTVPPVAFAIRQQLMFCELAKAFLPNGGKKPKRGA